MSKLATIQIDDAPEVIAEMLTRGHFHSHQDGAWRYSPWGGECVYVNDPTAQFSHRAEFSHKRAAFAHPALKLYAVHHPDGTRGMRQFERNLEPIGWQMYGARDEGERALRAWLGDLLNP